MKEKVRQTLSPDLSSSFLFALELEGGAADSSVSEVPPYSGSDALLRYIHEIKVQQGGNIRSLLHKVK